MSASEDEAGGGGGGGWWKGLVATPLKALSSLLATGVVVGLGYIVVSSLQEDEDGDEEKLGRSSSEIDLERSGSASSDLSDDGEENDLFDVPVSKSRRRRGGKKKSSSGKSRGGAGSSSASASSSSGKERRWRGARSGQEVNVRFPENSDPSKRSLYVNRAIGISMEYPKAWIKQEMSSANMPVQFSARRPRTSRLSGGLSPTIIVCVEKAQEGTTLEKCIKSINARLGEGQTRKPEVVELFNHADKGGLAGKLLCHWVPCEIGGVNSRFWQWTFVLLHGRKSVSVQFVIPEKEKDRFKHEIKLFKTIMCRSIFLSDAPLKMDLQTADIAEVSEPKYGFSFSYPSACMDHEFFPSSGLIVRLLQADEEDETSPPTTAFLRSVPITSGATSAQLLDSIKSIAISDEDFTETEWLTKDAPAHLSGLDARQCSLLALPEGGERLVIDIVCFCANNRGFYWFFSCPERVRSDREDIFQFILRSSKVVSPENPVENPVQEDVHIKFSHRVRGLSLELPGSWGLSRETGQASIVQAFTNVSEETAATELHSQLFIHQVHVPEHVTNTLKFKDHLLKEIKGQFSESLTEGAVQKATLNGLEAIQFEAAATVAGTSIHMLFVCFLFEERGWYAQFACVDELWDGLQGTMEKALASMKIKTQKEIEAEASQNVLEAGSGAGASSSGTVSGSGRK